MPDNNSWRVDQATERAAALAVRVHCAISWPTGARCLNCHRPHQCPTNQWGWSVLTAAGWAEEDILALDARTGVWS